MEQKGELGSKGYRTEEKQRGWSGRQAARFNKENEEVARAVDNQYGTEQIRLTAAVREELSQRLHELGLRGVEPERRATGPIGKERLDLILAGLMKYNQLKRSHLSTMYYYNTVGRGRDNLISRELTLLLAGGWIERERYNVREYVYRLGYWGKVLAASFGRTYFGDRRLLLEHDLLIADCMTRLQSEARAGGGRVDWSGEYEIELTGELRPDATGLVTISGERVDFFLEADTGSERGGTFGQKYPNYVRYAAGAVEQWQRKFQRRDFPVVLVVTRGREIRLAGMIEEIESRMSISKPAVVVRFYFTTSGRIEKAVAADPDKGVLLFEQLWSVPFSSDRYALWG